MSQVRVINRHTVNTIQTYIFIWLRTTYILCIAGRHLQFVFRKQNVNLHYSRVPITLHVFFGIEGVVVYTTIFKLCVRPFFKYKNTLTSERSATDIEKREKF